MCVISFMASLKNKKKISLVVIVVWTSYMTDTNPIILAEEQRGNSLSLLMQKLTPLL